MQGRKMIMWDENDRARVAREAFKISEGVLSYPLRAVLSRAQNVLPKDKHRPLGKVEDKNLAWLVPMWEEMKRNADALNGAHALFSTAEVENAMPTTEPVAEVIASDTPSETPEAAAEPVDEPQTDARPSSSEASGSNDRKMAVHWKDEHKTKVIDKAYALMQAFPDMKKLEAVRKAMQSELGPDLQRDLATWGMVSAWADPMLEKLEVDARILAFEQKRAREAREEADRAEAERLEALRLVEQQAEQLRAAQFEAAVTERVEKLSFDDLIKAFAAKLARDVIAGIGSEFEKQMAGAITHAVAKGVIQKETTPSSDDKLISPPSARLPLVGVVGLLNQQAEDIRKAFLGTIEFVFVKATQEGGNGGPHMLERCSRCDVVIAMTDHMGHDIEASAKKLNVPYKRLTGSVSSLKRFLSSWINGEVVLKAA